MDLQGFIFPVDGTYTVFVTSGALDPSDPSASGVYVLTVTDVTDTFGDGGVIAVPRTLDTAQPLGLTVGVAGAFQTDPDRDRFQFSGGAGELVSASIGTFSGQGTPRIVFAEPGLAPSTNPDSPNQVSGILETTGLIDLLVDTGPQGLPNVPDAYGLFLAVHAAAARPAAEAAQLARVAAQLREALETTLVGR